MQHEQQVRYARQISLPQIGQEGQAKLAAAKVLVVGAGGLGSPLLLYLAGAGIGTLGVVDHDRVALSNLQRQVLHETADIGRLKAESAADALHDLNPEIKVVAHAERLTEANADALIAAYDIIADGSDNFATRFLVNAYCLKHQKTLVSAAVIGFEGQLYTFKPYVGAPHPCYRCLCPQLPPAEALPDCSQSGVLGGMTGLLGSWQAVEVIKEIVGIGDSLSGQMLRVDGLSATVRKVKIPRDPECGCCGKKT